MDVSLHGGDRLAHPWRTLALVAASVAAAELIVLVVVGGALLARPGTASSVRPTHKAQPAKVQRATATPARGIATRAPAAELARRNVTVLVLNGNGRQGAAAQTASRVSRRGYRIGAVANAPRSDFTRSLVMYRKGFEGEGRRLARDLGLRIVGPLDGLRPAQLHGAHVVVVVGA